MGWRSRRKSRSPVGKLAIDASVRGQYLVSGGEGCEGEGWDRQVYRFLPVISTALYRHTIATSIAHRGL